jgi:hypothetical protein
MARARMIWWVLDDGEAWQVGGALCFADMDGSGISRTGAPVLGEPAPLLLKLVT